MLNTQRDPETNRLGERQDGRDLIQEWLDSRSLLGNAQYVWEQTGFNAVDPATTDYLLGKHSFNPLYISNTVDCTFSDHGDHSITFSMSTVSRKQEVVKTHILLFLSEFFL